MAKVDAELKTWARPVTGHGGTLLGKKSMFDGLWRYYYRTSKIKKVCQNQFVVGLNYDVLVRCSELKIS